MKAKKFEQQFDEGVDLTASLDVFKAQRVLQEQKRVNVDFPTWKIDSLDREASKLGVTRQSVIKVWLAERLEATASSVPLLQTRSGIVRRKTCRRLCLCLVRHIRFSVALIVLVPLRSARSRANWVECVSSSGFAG